MKRIFLIMALMLTAILTAQTATWTGAKTFGSTLKFLNVLQNDANTRIMSLDATGKPGWVSKSALSSSIPTFEQVLQAGNQVSGTTASDGFTLETLNGGRAVYTATGMYLIRSDSFPARTYITPGNITLGNSEFGNDAHLMANLVTGSKTFQFPNQSGTLLVAPTPVFADNAAAITGGLAVNQTYRTATGQVMIVF